MDSVMPNLPIEIAEKILLRIPARSVLRLKTVCKQWRSLISDPKFVTDHLNHSFSDEGNLHHRVVGVTQNPSQHLFISSQSIDHPSLNLTLTRFNIQIEPPLHARIIGSCNGLLLLEINYFLNSFHKLLLWNPLFTEKRKYLPPRNLTSSGYPNRFVGLGYASSVDDYKVVALCTKSYEHNYVRNVQVLEGKIYSLKSDSWRTIQSYTVPNLTGSVKPGTHVQGSIYWAVSPYEFILAFDLTREKFKRIETPPRSSYTSSFNMVEIQGCLAAYRSDSENGDVLIWTWKNEEWSKLVTVPKEWGKFIGCVCSVNNHQLVLQLLRVISRFTFRHFVICDLECMTPREIPSGSDCRWGLEVHMVETLVSPIGGVMAGKFKDS